MTPFEAITTEKLQTINHSLLEASQSAWINPANAVNIFARQFQTLSTAYGLTAWDNKTDFAFPGKLLTVDGEELLRLHEDGVKIEGPIPMDNISLIQPFTLVVIQPKIQELALTGKTWQQLHVAILPNEPTEKIEIELSEERVQMMNPRELPVTSS